MTDPCEDAHFLPEETCAREPIHTPGSIQPHGALLAAAFDDDALPVVAASANAAELLGAAPLGRPLGAVLGTAYAAALLAQRRAGALGGVSPWETTLPGSGGRPALEAAAHESAGLAIVELEPADATGDAGALAVSRLLQRCLGRLRAAEGDLGPLARVAAQEMRRLTGYERVMIYRFDPDWHGWVVAEDKAADWEQSMDGLCFPASDIPRQARALYARSLVRVVPARDATPVPVETDERRPLPPLDLSWARLRSLSPVHLGYHRHMGVDGSMSLSLLNEGRLWGLVICHHRGPHAPSPARRAASLTLADAFALRIAPAERAEEEARRRTYAQATADLLAHMAAADDLPGALASGSTTLAGLFDSVGAAALHAGGTVLVGRTPPLADVEALAAWLRTRPEQEMVHTAGLPGLYPAFQPHAAIASGLLAVFLSACRSEMVMWFRPEEPQTVSWGGNPYESSQTADGAPRPRRSFERWIETRRGQARAWVAWELEAAGDLRHAIMEVVVRSLRRLAAVTEQVRQAQKMEAVGQLTGGIAHDFNNLLTGIIGSLDMLRTRMAQGRAQDLDRYLDAAEGAAGRAAALTHRLLAFARRQTLDPRPTAVNRLVTGMEDLIRRTVGPAIRTETALAPGLWPTLCDPNQLENALLNLCINARDAMPGGGRLTIATANVVADAAGAAALRDMAPGEYVALSVTDNGSGMAAEVVARAFEPFFTTKPAGQGTGLGLSMTYGFTRQSGGHVTIHSAEGVGTTVRLCLPRYQGAEVAEPADEGEAPLRSQAEPTGTVLLVDDEPTIRMLAGEALRGLGLDAIEAGEGAAALRILASGRAIDLMVTDVGLPGGMDGRQLAAAARAGHPGLGILFITGYAESALDGEGLLGPGMQVLLKPFTMRTLAERVRAMLAA